MCSKRSASMPAVSFRGWGAGASCPGTGSFLVVLGREQPLDADGAFGVAVGLEEQASGVAEGAEGLVEDAEHRPRRRLEVAPPRLQVLAVDADEFQRVGPLRRLRLRLRGRAGRVRGPAPLARLAVSLGGRLRPRHRRPPSRDSVGMDDASSESSAADLARSFSCRCCRDSSCRDSRRIVAFAKIPRASSWMERSIEAGHTLPPPKMAPGYRVTNVPLVDSPAPNPVAPSRFAAAAAAACGSSFIDQPPS